MSYYMAENEAIIMAMNFELITEWLSQKGHVIGPQ